MTNIIKLTIPLPQFSHSVEATYFLRENPEPDLLKTTSEKLRWYRYYNNLLQIEVADSIGIHRTTYIHYENTNYEQFSIEILKRISKLYNINVTQLLDEYNLFIYNGQGAKIKALRNELELNTIEFARLCNTSSDNIIKWENEKVVISKSSWKKLNKIISYTQK